MTTESARKGFEVWWTGPDTWCGRWLRTFWHPVHRSQDLTPSQAKTIRILNEDLTLYRSQGGEAHLIASRCGHRGMQLSAGWVEGDNLRCFFHGWLYAPSGQCIEQPAERSPFHEKIKLSGYPTQEYLGLIFAYMGEGEPPPLPRYPDFEVGGIVDTKRRVGSYFDHMGIDTAHSGFVHNRNRTTWRTRGIGETRVVETEWGISDVYEPGEVVNIGHHGMPNVSHHIHQVQTRPQDLRWVVPVDDDHNVDFSLDRVLTEEQLRFHESRGPLYSEEAERAAEVGRKILAGEMRIEEVEATEHKRFITNVQDTVAQGGLGPVSGRPPDHLGPADAGIILRRTIQEREMHSLAEGRPLTQWVRPPSLYVPFLRDYERPLMQHIIAAGGG